MKPRLAPGFSTRISGGAAVGYAPLPAPTTTVPPPLEPPPTTTPPPLVLLVTTVVEPVCEPPPTTTPLLPVLLVTIVVVPPPPAQLWPHRPSTQCQEFPRRTHWPSS